MEYKTAYQPSAPCEGRYLIQIMYVRRYKGRIALYYDIAVGPCAGYAYTFYLQYGKWPLIWWINAEAGQAVIQYALRALNKGAQTVISTIFDATGCNLTVDIGLYDRYLEVRRSYPASAFQIMPEDIRIGTESWKAGTKDIVRATILAKLSGLPVLRADTQERKSPMIDWCAANQIILLPSKFPAGDYTTPNGRIIVDRKADLAELDRDFASSIDRVSYENAAFYAAAERKRLIYIIGTSPDDGVFQLEDLKHWSGSHPKIRDKQISGKHLYEQLIRYKHIHPNTDFLFTPNDKLCETIYNTASQSIDFVPTRKILSA